MVKTRLNVKKLKMLSSVTRLGDFWKFFVTNVTLKLAQISGNFLNDVGVYNFWWKNFWASIGKFGLLLIPTSGHADAVIQTTNKLRLFCHKMCHHLTKLISRPSKIHCYPKSKKHYFTENVTKFSHYICNYAYYLTRKTNKFFFRCS